MKKTLILLFTVAVLAGCITDPELGRIDKWEGFPIYPESSYSSGFWAKAGNYRGTSKMFETLTGIPAGTVKTSERVFIHTESHWLVPDTYSLVRITGAKPTYVLAVLLGGQNEYYPSGHIVLVIDGWAVVLKTETKKDSVATLLLEWAMAEVPPEYVEELFASDDIRIGTWRTKTIKLTEKEISYLRMLSPQKPQ